MSLYQRLQTETAAARRRFHALPMLAAALRDGVERDLYVAYLGQAYHHVRHTCPLLAAAAGRCGDGDARLREALFDYIAEEKGHEAWILDDIEAIGGADAVPRVLATDGDPAVRALVGYMYYAVERISPYAMLGMVYVLEGTLRSRRRQRSPAVSARSRSAASATCVRTERSTSTMSPSSARWPTASRTRPGRRSSSTRRTWFTGCGARCSPTSSPTGRSGAMRLDGKVVLITGAGSGIGRALAEEAARRGASLVLNGRREAPLRDTVARLPSATAVEVVAGDAAEAAGRGAALRTVGERFGRLDVLVNNAGTLATGPLASLDDAALAAMARTNLVAPAALTRDCLPLLRRSAGRIANIGSVFGDIAYPYFALYSATKFGLRGLSDALRRELAVDGIGVTYVAPRATRTDAVAAFENLVEPFAMTLDPVEKVARQTWDAVERDARSVYPRGPERLFVLLRRLAPGLIDGGVVRQLAKVERIAGGATRSARRA